MFVEVSKVLVPAGVLWLALWQRSEKAGSDRTAALKAALELAKELGDQAQVNEVERAARAHLRSRTRVPLVGAERRSAIVCTITFFPVLAYQSVMLFRGAPQPDAETTRIVIDVAELVVLSWIVVSATYMAWFLLSVVRNKPIRRPKDAALAWRDHRDRVFRP